MYKVDLCNLGSDQLLLYLEFIHRIQNNVAQFRLCIMHFIRGMMKIIYFSYIILLKLYFVTDIFRFTPKIRMYKNIQVSNFIQFCVTYTCRLSLHHMMQLVILRHITFAHTAFIINKAFYSPGKST